MCLENGINILEKGAASIIMVADGSSLSLQNIGTHLPVYNVS